MAKLVMKFGGASLCKPELFSHVADLIVDRHKTYDDIVVVVSAMGDTTNQLLKLAREVHPEPPTRELDMMVSVGERISIALLAMALSLKGKEAISLTGSQSGILTTHEHSEAKIVEVRPSRILKHLKEGRIVIVAGFQGVSSQGEITTLGRGGSDTSAVALGVALAAEKVEFFKDVDGVYSEDPKKALDATKFSFLPYQDALDIIRRGSKILHARSVELAEKNKIPLHVLSFHKALDPLPQGTWIGSDGPKEDFCTSPIYEGGI
jgi:aspartate kinase